MPAESSREPLVPKLAPASTGQSHGIIEEGTACAPPPRRNPASCIPATAPRQNPHFCTFALWTESPMRRGGARCTSPTAKSHGANRGCSSGWVIGIGTSMVERRWSSRGAAALLLSMTPIPGTLEGQRRRVTTSSSAEEDSRRAYNKLVTAPSPFRFGTYRLTALDEVRRRRSQDSAAALREGPCFKDSPIRQKDRA